MILPAQGRYKIDHSGDHLYMLTNDGAPNFRLMRLDLEGLDGTWTEVLAHDPDRSRRARRVPVSGPDRTPRRLRGSPCSTSRTAHLHPRDAGRSPAPSGSADCFTTFRHDYTSSLRRRSSNGPDTGVSTVIKTRPVLGGYDPEDYVTHRLEAIDDGVRMPSSFIAGNPGRHQPPVPHGIRRLWLVVRPVLLLEPALSTRPWGDLRHRPRAWRRGAGSDVVRGWKVPRQEEHLPGLHLLREMLRDNGWAAPDRIAIEGGSAGGSDRQILNLRPTSSRSPSPTCVRRRDEHHARPEHSPTKQYGNGATRRTRLLRLHARLLALRQRA